MSNMKDQVFMDRVNASVMALGHQGIRPTSVHISPITAMSLMADATDTLWGMSRSSGRLGLPLVLRTPIGPLTVEVEPDMADDIFVFGLR